MDTDGGSHGSYDVGPDSSSMLVRQLVLFGKMFFLLVLNAGNEGMIHNNHPIPPFPSIPY